MSITDEGIDRLLAAKAKILAEPERFDMAFWFRDGSIPGFYYDPMGACVIRGSQQLVPRDKPLAAMEHCGTTCCIAGRIVADAGEHVRPGETISAEAARLIGASNPDPGLFDASSWPDDLAAEYEAATSDAARARVAAEAIDRWIEVDGDEARFV